MKKHPLTRGAVAADMARTARWFKGGLILAAVAAGCAVLTTAVDREIARMDLVAAKEAATELAPEQLCRTDAVGLAEGVKSVLSGSKTAQAIAAAERGGCP